eukprot:TRINITY_DN4128_c0_g1_i1.p1 TRINITY_DN4128_c0_g1~~TRINITY_DN4128_c0_g1_i1.p1  ORF type:complete len:152 (+),score=51.95 TRINITY_DN4128_c0_g1_i1:204-659(+)
MLLRSSCQNIFIKSHLDPKYLPRKSLVLPFIQKSIRNSSPSPFFSSSLSHSSASISPSLIPNRNVNILSSMAQQWKNRASKNRQKLTDITNKESIISNEVNELKEEIKVEEQTSGMKAVTTAICTNSILSITKIVAFVFSGSGSMLSEAAG